MVNPRWTGYDDGLPLLLHERMTMATMKRVGLLLIGVCVAACGGGDESPDAAPPDATPPDAAVPDATPIPDASTAPMSLRETGLYADFENQVLAPGVREFTPTYQLWSDTAAKKRWVFLPPDSQIDSTDMDYWVYPVGTRLWKEFWRDGVRVETRLLYKTRDIEGPSGWLMRTFVWNEAQTDALLVRGGQADVVGTEHDVPSEIQCLRCHSGSPDVGLGFSAVLLDHTGSGVNLEWLVSRGMLTVPPEAASPPYFPLPGTQAQQDTLGYLHTNCGGCHNPTTELFMSGDALMNLRLMTREIATVEGSPAFTTTVCQEMQKPIALAAQIIVPGSPDTSAMYLRMNQRGTEDEMPQLGSEVVDPTGVAAVRDWIQNISACPQ
jgi:hypothetical protein